MNWGLKIVIGLAAFIVFIVSLGIYMVSKDTDSLVDKDYYEKSLSYDEVYVKKQNLVNDNAKPVVKVGVDTLIITFKQIGNKGKLNFKRPSNGSLDKSVLFETKTATYLLPIDDYVKGSWSLEIDWVGDGKAYISSHPVFL